MPTNRNGSVRLPFGVPILFAAFTVLGTVLAITDDGDRAASIAVAGFGVWGLCLWSGLEARSPLPAGARPWAPLVGAAVAVITGMLMIASIGSVSASSSSLSPEAIRTFAAVFAGFFGVAGVVVAVRLFRGDRLGRT